MYFETPHDNPRQKKYWRIKKITNLCRLKRLAAILLTGILFFNWYGYQLLSLYWQQQAESRLEARLDGNEYQQSDLFSIKIPLHTLSYNNGSDGFERVRGHLDIGGVRYNYVKRRIFND